MAKHLVFGLLILVALQVLTSEAVFIQHLKPRSIEKDSEIQFPWTSWLQNDLYRTKMETSKLPRCENRFEFYFGNCIPHPRRLYL